MVDDSVDTAEMLALFLEAHGHDVEVVHDGHRALHTAETFRPDVVLLDLSMPGLSGLDVCRQLRQSPWAMGVLVIALTGWTGERHRNDSAAAGFDLYLTKPVEPTALIRILSRGDPSTDA